MLNLCSKEWCEKIENHQRWDPKGIQNPLKIHPQIYQKMNANNFTKTRSNRRVGGCGAPPYSYLFRPTLRKRPPSTAEPFRTVRGLACSGRGRIWVRHAARAPPPPHFVDRRFGACVCCSCWRFAKRKMGAMQFRYIDFWRFLAVFDFLLRLLAVQRSAKICSETTQAVKTHVRGSLQRELEQQMLFDHLRYPPKLFDVQF